MTQYELVSEEKRSDSDPLLSRSSVVFIDVAKVAVFQENAKEGVAFLPQAVLPEWTFEASSYTLTFNEPQVERAYRAHILGNAQKQNKIFLALLAAFVCLMGAFEYGCNVAESNRHAAVLLAALRAWIVLLCACLFWMSSRLQLYRSVAELALAVLYNLISASFILVQVVGTLYCRREFTETNRTLNGEVKEEFPIYAFFDGLWSLPESLLFIAFLFHCSCLPFITATVTAMIHYFAQLVLVCSLPGHATVPIPLKAGRVPAFIVICMASCYIIECRLRRTFISRCQAAHQQDKRQQLIHSSKCRAGKPKRG
jgi:hypothetical protein